MVVNSHRGAEGRRSPTVTAPLRRFGRWVGHGHSGSFIRNQVIPALASFYSINNPDKQSWTSIDWRVTFDRIASGGHTLSVSTATNRLTSETYDVLGNHTSLEDPQGEAFAPFTRTSGTSGTEGR